MKSFVMLLVAVMVLGGAAGYGASAIAGNGGGGGTQPPATGVGQTASNDGRQAGTAQATSQQTAGQTASGQQSTSQPTAGPQGQGIMGGGTMGTVQKIDGNLITLAVRDGSTVQVEVNDKTAVQKTGQGSIGDILPGQFLTAIGDTQSDSSVDATSISIVPEATGQPGGGGQMSGRMGQGSMFTRGGTLGTVEKVEGSVITLKATDGSKAQVKVSEKTVIQKTVQGSISDIVTGGSIVVVGSKRDDGVIDATSISIMNTSVLRTR